MAENGTETTISTTVDTTVADTETTVDSTTAIPSCGSGECESIGFFRAPDSCTKFYRCLAFHDIPGFSKFDFECPDGTHFDPTLNVCNFPVLMSPPCNESAPSCDTTVPRIATPAQVDYEPVQTPREYEPVTELPPVSLESHNKNGSFQIQCETGMFHRHPVFCDQYYTCRLHLLDIKVMVEKCPNEGRYDESTQRCLPPRSENDDSECLLTASVQDVAELRGKRSIAEASNSFAHPQEIFNGDLFQCHEPGFYSFEGGCTRFYKCSRSNATSAHLEVELLACPSGYSFVSQSRRCEPQSIADTDDTCSRHMDTAILSLTTLVLTPDEVLNTPRIPVSYVPFYFGS
ncbi:unnamed protein product [Cyprideis torosa]|uniref:Uncharacterized protein n=1 Tax=Cyprideis torosa TaxID=163714 RepID=A0A7R8W4F5_9CRUS|nr:unnamed protein product [Cyprideis torosa]CAG0880580.1 unnamed protein product [Cyprideis torosa]